MLKLYVGWAKGVGNQGHTTRHSAQAGIQGR